jgi:hypothetical protein
LQIELGCWLLAVCFYSALAGTLQLQFKFILQNSKLQYATAEDVDVWMRQ